MKNLLRFFLTISVLFALSANSAFAAAPKENDKPVQDHPAGKESVSTQKSVTIITETQTNAAPEIGVIILQFPAYGWSVEKAKMKADKLIREFNEKLSKEKIAPPKIEVGDAKLRPSYLFNRDLKTNVPSDFLVSRKVTLVLDNVADIEKIMDVSISIGSFLLESVHLTVKDKSALEQTAFQNAIDDGRKKAEGIAKSLGMTIDKVQNVEELDSSIEEVNVIQESELSMSAASQIKESKTEKEETEPKENSVEKEKSSAMTDQIHARTHLKITFSLSPKE